MPYVGVELLHSRPVDGTHFAQTHSTGSKGGGQINWKDSTVTYNLALFQLLLARARTVALYAQRRGSPLGGHTDVEEYTFLTLQCFVM